MTTTPARPPLADDTKLTIGDVAKWLGLRHADTVQHYLARARRRRLRGHTEPWLFPEPDGHEEVTGTAWWFGSTIKAWDASRPGRGAWGARQNASK